MTIFDGTDDLLGSNVAAHQQLQFNGFLDHFLTNLQAILDKSERVKVVYWHVIDECLHTYER